MKIETEEEVSFRNMLHIIYPYQFQEFKELFVLLNGYTNFQLYEIT